jgi:hypothetical protein
MRTLILMATFLSALGRLFGGEPSQTTYKTADVYNGLRKQILGLKAEELGAPTNQAVLALVMETGYPEAVATLVAVMDGSASLYFSNGGGIIGAGKNPGPNAAARNLVAKAAGFRSACALTQEFPLPPRAHTRFYLVTPKGVLTAEAKADDLGNGRNRISPLFHAAHELITQIRLTEEKRRAEPGGPPKEAPPPR